MQLSAEEKRNVRAAQKIFLEATVLHDPALDLLTTLERLLPERDGLTQYQLLDPEGKKDRQAMYKQVVSLSHSINIKYARELFRNLKQTDFAAENQYDFKMPFPPATGKRPYFSLDLGVTPDDAINIIHKTKKLTGLSYDALLGQKDAETALTMERKRGYTQIAHCAFENLPNSFYPKHIKAVLYECLATIHADASILSDNISAPKMDEVITSRAKQAYLQLAFKTLLTVGGTGNRWPTKLPNSTENESTTIFKERISTVSAAVKNSSGPSSHIHAILTEGGASYEDLAFYTLSKMQEPEFEKFPQTQNLVTKYLHGRTEQDAKSGIEMLINCLSALKNNQSARQRS